MLSGVQAPGQGTKSARLLIVRDGDDAREVEIVHEALIRDWTQLQQWIDTGAPNN